MAGYLLSPHAAEDLEDIFEYTLVNWGESQLHRYRKSISLALDAVARDPMLPGSKAREDLLPGCRFYQLSITTSPTGRGRTSLRWAGFFTSE